MPGIKITQFGGLLPKAMRNLDVSMATKAIDVDLSRHTLRPWRTDKKVSDNTGNALFVDHCCYLTDKNCKASFSRINTDCKYIVATGVKSYPVINKKEEACNGDWLRLGFPIEIPAPNTERSGNLTNDFNNEARQYYYTLVDSFGYESAPSLPSEILMCNNDEDVVISNIQATFDTYNIVSVNIYCAVTPLDYGEGIKRDEDDAAFLFVDSVNAGVSTYVHKAHTAYGDMCITEEFEPPHHCMRDIQYCGNGQIGGLVNHELWLSEPLLPHAFPEAYRYGNFNGRPERFLCGERIGYILTDEFPHVIEMQSPCTTQGCRSVSMIEERLPLISYQSACMYNGSCFYASHDGLVMLSGGQARIITSNLYTVDQWQALRPWNMVGVVYEGYYFGFNAETTIRFKVPDDIHEQVDINNLTELSIHPTAAYVGDQDGLYFILSDGVYKWNAGDGWKTFEWQGRVQLLPGYTAMTAYKLVHDYSPATVVHKAYKRHRSEMVQDVVELGNKEVIDSRPRRLKAGYSTLEFDVNIKSKGEVYEYHASTSVAELGAQ